MWFLEQPADTGAASTPPCVTPDNGASSTRRGKDGKEVVWKMRGEAKEGGEERMTTQRGETRAHARSTPKAPTSHPSLLPFQFHPLARVTQN